MKTIQSEYLEVTHFIFKTGWIKYGTSLFSRPYRDELQLRKELLEFPWTFLNGKWFGQNYILNKLKAYTLNAITDTLTSQVWLSRLTAAVFRPMMMANAEFKFLWALQLQAHKSVLILVHLIDAGV